MKIGILTQALHGNYGGILQNYALQQVLKHMGHNPVTIDRHKFSPDSRIKGIAKRIMRLRKPYFEASMLTGSEKKRMCAAQLSFVECYIDRLGPIYSQSAFDEIVSDQLWDAFVVGSDQCWRPRYSANISNYFLDFADKSDVSRIAYASSFGVDSWEYSSEQTAKAAKAAKKMDAISVRELSGVRLCNDYLGVKAQWVLDPTMLLGVEGFRQFVKEDNVSQSFITDYVLEQSTETLSLIEQIKRDCSAPEIRHNNNTKTYKRFESISKYADISVEDWISNIANARFVITDSFHGTVFAILFNVPFMVVLNGIRGNARIESLLTDFDLTHCIYDGQKFSSPKIDWDKVNSHLKIRQEQSNEFLANALK